MVCSREEARTPPRCCVSLSVWDSQVSPSVGLLSCGELKIMSEYQRWESSQSPDRKLPILVGHYDRDARRTPECPCHAAVPTRDPAWAGATTAARHANAAVQRPSKLAAPGDPRSVAANAVAL